MENLKSLLTSRRVWVAVLAVIINALHVVYPQISTALVDAFNTFALALIGAFTVEDLAKQGAFSATHYHMIVDETEETKELIT